MPDDLSKRYKDRDTVSWQDWEIEHVVDKLCKDFPKKPRPAKRYQRPGLLFLLHALRAFHIVAI